MVREVLDQYKKAGNEFDTFTLLQPTTPLRTHQDIIEGYKLLEEKNAGAIVSVCESEHTLSIYNYLPDDMSLTDFLDTSGLHSGQKSYRLNGAVYISTVEHFESHASIYDENCYAMVMPQERSVDVDTNLDFMIAETIIKYIQHN